jgi:hypothetical protein
MKKIIIAGSRNFDNFIFLRNKMDFLLLESSIEDVLIISGTARGADKLGERYAETRGIEIKRMPANWDKHGKSAGYKRNEQMAQIATHCVLFWDGKSRGTMHMRDLARQYNLILRVYRY